MDFLQSVLAGFIDKFKAKNPFVYVLVVLVLMTLNYAAGNAVDMGVVDLAKVPWLAQTLEILSQVLIILTGSRTVKYMTEPKDDPAQMRYNPDYND